MIHLALLAVGRRGQRHEPEHARADALGDRLDGAALAGGVAALETTMIAQALLLDPLLEMAELGLELAQLLLIGLRFICSPSSPVLESFFFPLAIGGFSVVIDSL